MLVLVRVLSQQWEADQDCRLRAKQKVPKENQLADFITHSTFTYTAQSTSVSLHLVWLVHLLADKDFFQMYSDSSTTLFTCTCWHYFEEIRAVAVPIVNITSQLQKRGGSLPKTYLTTALLGRMNLKIYIWPHLSIVSIDCCLFHSHFVLSRLT